MEQKSNINPAILQQMLESATNAAEKGQSQFFTPVETGTLLAQSLPRVRPLIVDLNCGAGNLLLSAATKDTDYLLGADIDPCKPSRSKDAPAPPPARAINRITHDLTRLYPLLKEVDWRADLFVLNPPWRLWWHRDRLQDLAHSHVDAVREAFAQMEEAAHRKDTVDGTIDSTIATLMIAYDRCTHCGEGLLIANNATLERLIFTPGAPYSALARHIWAHLVIPGNPMTGIDDCLWENGEQFMTGVIYFAPDHDAGPRKYHWPQLPDRASRLGSELRSAFYRHDSTVEIWSAVQDKVAELNGRAPRNPFNLWLNVNGRIRTNLSTFEERSTRVDKKEAARLFELEGRTPMELVLQRAQRDELLHVVEKGGWRVEPALVTAVQQAVADYHSARAPLYPLPDIQRLGYLDEQDTIACKKDLLSNPDTSPAGAKPTLIFRAGRHYPIRTQTVQVTRASTKFNPFTNADDLIEHSGQELAIYISADNVEYCFMDGKIKADKKTTVAHTGKQSAHADTGVQIDFTLQQIAEYFVIPDVPDVASANPEGYRKNLETLDELERLTEILSL